MKIGNRIVISGNEDQQNLKNDGRFQDIGFSGDLAAYVVF